jgi:hypothetical protein
MLISTDPGDEGPADGAGVARPLQLQPLSDASFVEPDKGPRIVKSSILTYMLAVDKKSSIYR